MKILFCRISILFLIYTAPSLASSMTLVSDSLVFDEHLKRVDATGNVSLKLHDATILGDHLMFYSDDNIVVSSGNVIIKRDDNEFKSGSLFINLDDKKLHLNDLRIGIVPYEKKGQIYVTIKNLIDGEKRKIGHYARFTTCNELKPHYYLDSWRFVYYPDKSLHLWGSQFRNDLSFFPFNFIPFPIPLIEWIPIPYYYYQLGNRKIVLNFPTIGEKKNDGWGLFVQNKIDYRYHNNQESTLFLDWYDAKENRSGEWGYGIHHYYGNDTVNGNFYIYNYDFKVGDTHKKNVTYTLQKSLMYKNMSFSGNYKLVEVDERINSTGSSHTIDKAISFIQSSDSFPLSSSYKESNNISNQFQSQIFNFKKEFLHQNMTFSLNKKKYSKTNRYTNLSKLTHFIELPNNIHINQAFSFNEYDYPDTTNFPEQTLKYVSNLSTELPKNIKMSVYINYLHDLDQDTVTSDIKSGINNYLYKLPEITFSQRQTVFKSRPSYSFRSHSMATIGNYREVRYFQDDPQYAFPNISNKIEPNVYFFSQHLSKSLSIPASSTVVLSSTYKQYIFKNENISLFKGDAQYSFQYTISVNSKFFSFLKHTSSYNRQYGDRDNNSPFYSFQKSISEQNRLTEKITFFYHKQRSIKYPFSFDFTWDHSTSYNWLLSSSPYSNYVSKLAMTLNNYYRATIQSSKNLNKTWKKENNLFTPLMFTLQGRKKDSFNFNYSLQLDMNDLVFDKLYIVRSSSFNFHFPLGKHPDFKWNIKGYFNYLDTGKVFQLKRYQFQTFSIVKNEHERQIELGYNKSLKELFFKFHFKMFSNDPLILRKTDNVVKFEGRLNKKSKERF